MKSIFSILIIAICFSLTNTYSQHFIRIKADFSIKNKNYDGSASLTMGTVYYDIMSQSLVYEINFPNTETWVLKDSLLYKIQNQKIISQQRMPSIVEFSIFHLCLNGELSDYGLKNTNFTIKEVESEEGMVITTWEPPTEYRDIMGNTLISNKNERLYGIVFLSPEEEVLSKQFFNNYNNYSGLEFPTEIIQINYVEKQENYQITSFRNVVVNDFGENNIYNYSIKNLKQ